MATPTKSQIVPGDLAIVKSTGERVFVVQVRKAGQLPENIELDTALFSGLEVIVRRALMGEKEGLFYQFDVFLLEELELPEDAAERNLREIRKLRQKSQEEAEAAVPFIPTKAN